MTDTSKMVGVIIGRFQTDVLHEAHRKIIAYARERHPHVLVFIGVRNSPPTSTNPLPYLAREQAIRTEFPDVVTMPLLDCMTNEEWSKNIDSGILSAFGWRKAILYSGRDGCIPDYTGIHLAESVTLNIKEISGTIVRERIGLRVENSPEFRRGMIYAMQNLPNRIYPTVDIAMFKAHQDDVNNDDVKILICRKVGEPGWRLPGGHLNLNEKPQLAASRELFEETGLSGDGEFRWLDDFVIDDWRVRGVQGVSYLTSLWSTQYQYGTPKAMDDINECQFVSTRTLKKEDFVLEHQVFFEAILKEAQRILFVMKPTFESEEENEE